MKSADTMHNSQVEVLKLLKYATRARYSELMRAAGQESDVFKYHIKVLLHKGFLVKATDGQYELTAEGKEFTSRLDVGTRRPVEQPKSSMLMVVRSGDKILAHKRTRQPFNGFWGIASAPVLRGVPLAHSAAAELQKQTGLIADFTVVGSYRVIDKNKRGIILEDKIFSVMLAELPYAPVVKEWTGGISEWMTIEELLSKDKLFPSTAPVLKMIAEKQFFGEEVCLYDSHEY